MKINKAFKGKGSGLLDTHAWKAKGGDRLGKRTLVDGTPHRQGTFRGNGHIKQDVGANMQTIYSLDRASRCMHKYIQVAI